MFKKIVLGGTFDHFHKGHKGLLDYAVDRAGEIVVGITSDEYVSKKDEEGNLEGYRVREKAVSEFLKSRSARFRILKIDDVFGTTLQEDFDAQAIVVTLETLRGADAINDARKKVGLPVLEVLSCPFVPAEDGSPISSDGIRRGRINREGRLSINPLWTKEELHITDEMRNELKSPFGELIVSPEREDFEGNRIIVSVGDESTKFINSLSIRPLISVIDFKVAREKKFSSLTELGFKGEEEVTHVINEPGTISPDLFKLAPTLFSSKKKQESVIIIEGEDDLAVLPMILAAPLGSYIFYGQPGQGIVKITVSEDGKKLAYDMAASFNTRGH